MIWVGVDEAGRGPVVGSMFVAAVALKDEDLEKLRRLGLTDSKKLTPKKRALLKEVIKEKALAIEIVEVKPEEMNERSVSDLTIEAMRKALESVLKRVRADVVIADVVGKGKKQAEILGKLHPNVKVLPKADSEYLVVSAASVVAKEAREEHVRKLKAKYGDFGSGYPSDKRTREWLVNNYDKPIVRRKWKTLQRVLSKQSSSSDEGHLT
ncbi:ribonuclease HII [Ignicoccus pacificus DSM 13166]|uniref:Ribonuclease n=1 Tax=Ignicoccus pacificus DSM 13166 TaxID=940294 RepID=A0A977K9N5_9CREN|nr:ribonuclease HII [Ignicoccus pacificus DSM 13166]